MNLHSKLKPLTSTNFYFIVDYNGNVTYLYSTEMNYLELHMEEAIGQPLQNVLPTYFPISFEKQLRKAMKENAPTSYMIEIDLHIKKQLEVEVYPIPKGFIVFIKEAMHEREIEIALQENLKTLVLLTETANDLIVKEKPKKILDTLFNSLSHYLDLDVYFNYILDEHSKKLKLMNFQGISNETAIEIQHLDLGEAVCGTVASNRSKIIVENVQQTVDPKVALIQSLGIEAYACYPLISHNRLIGTLSFGSKQRTKFTEEELLVIEKICNQVAVTLERLFLITELKERNQELKRSNKQLLISKNEAEKANKAKSDFLSLMNHELRTPLHSILGFAQVLTINEQNPLNSFQKDKVNKILEASRHLLTLINDILDLVRFETGTPLLNFESVDLRQIVSNSIEIIKPTADNHNIIIHHSIQSKVPNIRMDAFRLNQIVLNLLSNAIKYNHQNGQISVSYKLLDDHIKIIITDTGFGIDEEEQTKIFEPFYRSPHYSSLIEGTGIGLALVQKLVTELGGSIGVESSVGLGSTFWILFPIEKPLFHSTKSS
ncbi:ATP-binding protein [Halalkalibacter nanhaiisediminis]|uniref:histidine kinase n=1 Tax=Halalkalibacter nanhaiisediminis TaxID=688079 RepID=A0A562QR32_9BACI|nr:ATP-binding protein [Halalkalibacter nanhaiisediminis]TWI59167.1 signal transduction histidine kinase [Halalkalibacter nanhaiisediminis]